MEDSLDRLKAALADRYTIERELGRGGMATVYLASDCRHDRSVALKVLRSELAASVGPERFQREIKVAAHLQHPHIVPVHDSGEAAGQLWYTMPYIEGESLRGRLSRERHLSVEEALRIALEVSDALVYAHHHGIIHRDIKPENIMLSEGHAVVADFGIAATIAAVGGERLTQTGMVIGTPAYMSPEQASGDEGIDGRSDLYSLGCVLYEMLAGCPPFTGPTAQAVRARHALDPVPSLRTVRSTVPVALERVVLRVLAKLPVDRFATVAEFRKALSLTGIGKMPWRGGRVLLGLAVLTLSAAVVYWLIQRTPSSGDGHTAGVDSTTPLEYKRIAVLYFRPHGSDPDLRWVADGLTEGLIDTLRRVDQLEVQSANAVTPYRTLAISPESTARALNVAALVEGSVEKAGEGFGIAIWLVEASSGGTSSRRTLVGSQADLVPIQGELAKIVLSLLRERPRGPRSAWILLRRGNSALKDAESFAVNRDSTNFARAFAEADSLFAAAEQQDPNWADPFVRRGLVAYRRSRLSGRDQTVIRKWVDVGLGHVERALILGENNADALEVRGNLRYWSYLTGLEPDANKAKALLGSAQADLETATRINPAQAGAWATLSHLYNRTGSGVDVNLAARKAYEADPYIANADAVMKRLFLSSYDLAQFPDARHWCDETRRRFPTDSNAPECELFMLTTRAEQPDVARAWRLADSVAKMAPTLRRQFLTLSSNMMAAAVLARAGLKDSAARVAERSKGNSEISPTQDLALMGGFVYALLGDAEKAVRMLKTYFAANERLRAIYAEEPGWWLRPIANDPRFKQLVGSR